MAETEWVRVRDTRTDKILPNLVPRKHLDIYDYLKEVPSARRKKDRVALTEPLQPGALAPGSTTVEVTEPATTKATASRGKATTPVTEK